TVSCNMFDHMVMTGKTLLVDETECADALADVVDTVFCSTDAGRSKQSLSSFPELEAKFPKQFHNYQQQHRCLQEDREEWKRPRKTFRTAFKTPIRCTPYKLVYEKACHLPIELEHKAYLALKHANFDLQTAGDHRKVQLNEFNELRDQAYMNSLIYKEKTKRIHDSKIKDRVFNVGDRVLLFNSRLNILSGKLKTRCSRPFTITHVFPYGTIELSQTDGPNFKMNGHRLKHYFGEDIPKMVVPYLQTFPTDL
nr:reverse transcriptase domain-containing protein [Tanacetum cinerariifolium]